MRSLSALKIGLRLASSGVRSASLTAAVAACVTLARPASRFRRALAQDRVDAGFGEAGHLLLEVRALHRTQDALRGVVERLQERLAVALRGGRVIGVARELLVDVELLRDEVLLGGGAVEPVLHVLDLTDALSGDVAEALHRRADLTRLVMRDDPRGIGCHGADVLRCTEGFGKLGHGGVLQASIPRPSSGALNARTSARSHVAARPPASGSPGNSRLLDLDAATTRAWVRSFGRLNWRSSLWGGGRARSDVDGLAEPSCFRF
jgi:hypothetical protein